MINGSVVDPQDLIHKKCFHKRKSGKFPTMRYSIDAVVESFWWFNCVLLLYIKVLQCNIMSIVESRGKLQ